MNFVTEVGVRKTEVATADFTWVLFVPGGEVGLSAPPHLTRGQRGGRRDKEGGGGAVLSNSCLH